MHLQPQAEHIPPLLPGFNIEDHHILALILEEVYVVPEVWGVFPLAPATSFKHIGTAEHRQLLDIVHVSGAHILALAPAVTLQQTVRPVHTLQTAYLVLLSVQRCSLGLGGVLQCRLALEAAGQEAANQKLRCRV